MGQRPSATSARRIAATAHHEAGHAVAYFWLREMDRYPLPRMRRITIMPQADMLGHVAPFRTPSFQPDSDNSGPRVALRVQGEIQVYFAGRVAEERYTRHQVRSGFRPDFEQAADLAGYVTGSSEETTAMLDWLLLATKNLIEKRWSLVEAVAQALLKEQTLTGRAVADLIRAELRAQ